MPSLQTPVLSPWTFVDSGALSAADNMAIDQRALDAMDSGETSFPLIRFFEWTEPSVTYGYLLDFEKVKAWATPYGAVPIVKRPTGGGAVHHTPSDLSLSLLWPRHSAVLPSRPRDAYQKIHSRVKEAIERCTMVSYSGSAPLSLRRNNPPSSCEWIQNSSPAKNANRFSECFQEPVCNDVMLDDKKVVGGALRLTKKSILYQGTIQLGANMDMAALKTHLKSAFEGSF